jgi:hypothetical protein
MAHSLCMLDDLGYRHIFTICNNIVFPLQQWLNGSASILRYTYVACLGLKCNIYLPLDHVSRDACLTVVAILLPTECSVVTYILLGMSWYVHFVTNPTTRRGEVSDFSEPENPAVMLRI